MRWHPWRHLAILLVSLFTLLTPPPAALADGTETLGPPSIPIATGTHVVAKGTGLALQQPGVIDIFIPPGAVVKQVLLYWEGQMLTFVAGDPTVIVSGQPVTGKLIGGPRQFFGSAVSSAYRADITHLGLVNPGPNSIEISGVDFTRVSNGAGIIAIIDDGTTPAEIILRDGLDLAFFNFAPPLDTTVPQTYNFLPASTDRTASLSMFFSSVEGSASGFGPLRPTSIQVTVGGSTTLFSNLLNSTDGEEWDTLNLSVLIPAGATSMTVQALSRDDLRTGKLPASFAWIGSALSVPPAPTPCIKLRKEVSVDGGLVWFDANSEQTAPGADAGVEYRLIVNNCGDVDLHDVTLNDPVLAITDINIGSLPAGGADSILTKSSPGFFNLEQPNLCLTPIPPTKVNTASASGLFGQQQVMAQDAAQVRCICVDLEKDVSVDMGQTWFPADSVDLAPSTFMGAMYRLKVTNCGGFDLSDVTLQDLDLTPQINVNIGLLVAAESLFIQSDTPGFAGLNQPELCANPDPPTKRNTGKVVGTFSDGDFSFTTRDRNEAWANCIVCTGTIGDFVWDDKNQNGVQDAGEPGISGVPVTLSGTNVYGVPVNMTVNTGANGQYSFSGLCQGTYTVTVPTPMGYTPSPSFQGGDVTKDSNGSPATVTLPNDNANDPSIDFGFYKPMPSIDIEKYTNGDDADMPTGPKIPVGGMVEWKYVVKNTGNVELTGVAVTDDKLGAISCPKTVLAPMESMTCIKTGTAMEGQYANLGKATGAYNGATVMDQDPSHYYGVMASIDVEKYVSKDGGKTWYDADDAPGLSVPVCSQAPPAPTCKACSGGITELTLLYKGSKSAKIVVKDAKGNQLYSNTVNPNKTFTFKGVNNNGTMGSHIRIYVGSSFSTITTDCSKPIYAGLVVGSFTVVSGYSKDGGKLCDQTSASSNTSTSSVSSSTSLWWATSSSASFSIDDDADRNVYEGSDYDKAYSDSCGTIPVYSSCKVQFKYVVKNTGNTDLTNISLTDDKYDLFGKCTIPATLAPGASFSCLIGPFDAMAGQHTNTATATGQYNGIQVMDSDKANYFGGKPSTGCVRSPGYWKNHPEAWPVQTIVIGGITYTKAEAIKIMEKPVAGDKTYTLFRALVSAKLNVLSGADATCINDVITAADSWMAKYPVGSGVTGSSSAWYAGEPLYLRLDKYNNGYLCASYCGDQEPPPTSYPKIRIEKSTNGYDADMAPGPYIWVGDPVKWTYTVTNAGNTALSGIKVSDDKVFNIGCPKTSLMVGESMTCSATGIAVEGQYQNTGCAQGYASGNVKVSDCDLSHYYGQKKQTQTGCGTGTPGYWQNQPDAWPTRSITIGGTSYTRAKAIEIMAKSVAGDKTYTMFPALVSAKLNVMVGNNSSCISATISAADAWMNTYRLGSGVKGSSDAWKNGEPYYWALDNYNNGLLCAPHRDSTKAQCTSTLTSESFGY